MSWRTSAPQRVTAKPQAEFYRRVVAFLLGTLLVLQIFFHDWLSPLIECQCPQPNEQTRNDGFCPASSPLLLLRGSSFSTGDEFTLTQRHHDCAAGGLSHGTAAWHRQRAVVSNVFQSPSVAVINWIFGARNPPIKKRGFYGAPYNL